MLLAVDAGNTSIDHEIILPFNHHLPRPDLPALPRADSVGVFARETGVRHRDTTMPQDPTEIGPKPGQLKVSKRYT